MKFVCLYEKIKKSQNDLSLDEVVTEDSNGNVLTLEDVIPSDEDFVEDYNNELVYEDIRKIVCGFKGKESQIMRLHFGFDGYKLTQKEIAKITGFSQSYISRIISLNLKKIRNILVRKNLIEYNNLGNKDESKYVYTSEESK